jgi:hypothetical protein
MRSRVIGAPLTTLVVSQGRLLDDSVDVWIVKSATGIAFGLPTKPNDGDSFAVVDGSGNAPNANIFVQTGGPPNPPILGGGGGLTQVVINQAFYGFRFTYSAFLGAWIAEGFVSADLPASQTQLAALQAQMNALGNWVSTQGVGFEGDNALHTQTNPSNTAVAAIQLVPQESGVFESSGLITVSGNTNGHVLGVQLQVTQNPNGSVSGGTSVGNVGGKAVAGSGCFVLGSDANGGAGLGIPNLGGAISPISVQNTTVTGQLTANGDGQAIPLSGILTNNLAGSPKQPFVLGQPVFFFLTFAYSGVVQVGELTWGIKELPIG